MSIMVDDCRGCGTSLVRRASLEGADRDRPALMTSCLINSYNYGRFLRDAVDSALEQTPGFDEVIIVDDGSTDETLDLLENRYSGDCRVTVIAKDNGGQLSAFNAAFLASRGDILFFLDADDIYRPGYLKTVRRYYQEHPECDFLYCGYRKFGNLESEELSTTGDRDLGFSLIRTLKTRVWLGNPTSCLSLRRTTAARILPLPLEDDWRIRADDCLIFGASLVGARKHYLARPLVDYRIHGDNLFHGRSVDENGDFRRSLAISRLFGYLVKRQHYLLEELDDFIHREFCTCSDPTWQECRQYLKLASRSKRHLSRRWGMAVRILKHFLATRSNSARRAG
jgi:glycosyltransferase involved in cell wall biosynthesis